MAFVASVDNNPVYLGLDGKPLSNGRLSFFVFGDLLTPKTVYYDTARATEAPLVVQLNASGRAPGELFLGEGPYTVQSFAFTGTDPVNDPSTAWVLDNQWAEDGLPVSTPEVITDIINVATIADLGNLDTSLYHHAYVLGYYTEGDLFTRYYEWVPADIQTANGGTVIKHGIASTGSWLLRMGGTDVLDAGIFGFIPGTLPRNGALHACEAAIAAHKTLPQTLYLRAGTYSVSGNDSQFFNCDVKFDPGVLFSNVATGTTYTMTFLYELDFRHTSTGAYYIQSTASAGRVQLRFQNPLSISTVELAWVLPGNDYSKGFDGLNNISNDVLPNYTVHISQKLEVSAMTCTVPLAHTLLFTGNARIWQRQASTYVLEFLAPGEIINHTLNGTGDATAVNGVFYAGTTGYRQLKFTGYTLRSNFFASPTSTTMDLTSTIILNTFFKAVYHPLNTGGTVIVTDATPFIFDHPRNVFNDVSIPATASFIFSRESGNLVKTDPTGTLHIDMTRNSFDDSYFIEGYGFVLGGATNVISNWLAPFPTDTQCTSAWINALSSVAASGGTLDLCNATLTLTQNATFPGTSGAVVIRNGFVTMALSYPFINITGTNSSLKFRDVVFGSSSSMAPAVSVSGTSGSLELTNCSYTSINLGVASSSLFTMGVGATIGTVTIDRCSIHCHNISDFQSGVTTLIITDCPSIYADVYTDKCTVRVFGNYIFGASYGTWRYSCYGSTLIQGNYFHEVMLQVFDNMGLIDALICNNQFESTTSRNSFISFQAGTAETRFAGSLVSGNSFNGTVATGTNILQAIQLANPDPAINLYAGPRMWANKYTLPLKGHSMCFTNNTSSTSSILVPCTRGAVMEPLLSLSTASAMVLEYSKNPGIFYLQASIEDTTVVGVNITPVYNSTLANIPSYIGFDKKLVSYAVPSALLVGDDYTTVYFFNAEPASSTKIYESQYGVSIDLYPGTT